MRPYLPSDDAAIADVCVRTGHLGGDARALYPDHGLLPDLFALPYVRREPELAFVLDDGARAVGYILGTADTPGFVRWFREEWLAEVGPRRPPLERPPATPTDEMIHLLHTPERLLVPELAGHPAHLHIDLLPGVQRRGFGRALMAAFLGALAARGVPRVHLGMVTANEAARPFYDRLGFAELRVADAGPLTYLGRSTATDLSAPLVRTPRPGVRGGSRGEAGDEVVPGGFEAG
ncbi:GNAT family N-acetyltransferase [Actinocorallia herbida]|uniref:GNAT family N-acetyltransferase n=1 Tax=Actinocorallia herbida TaxID=58109 RepID=UPI001FE553A7|nr:GNAT family N-acetyltransferase [Actinocorallia herbida]